MRREFSAGGLVHKEIRGWLGGRGPTMGRGNLGWSWPKGWIDKGETPEQAAIREVRKRGSRGKSD